MRWFLAFHLIFVVCWFAGLFYLPRLFVYHAQCKDIIGDSRFKIMERRLYFGIMMPAALLTTLSGAWLLFLNPTLLSQHWMQWKLILVLGLWIYHFICAYFLRIFKENRNVYSHKFYRFMNEVPTVFLIAIIILAVVQS